MYHGFDWGIIIIYCKYLVHLIHTSKKRWMCPNGKEASIKTSSFLKNNQIFCFLLQLTCMMSKIQDGLKYTNCNCCCYFLLEKKSKVEVDRFENKHQKFREIPCTKTCDLAILYFPGGWSPHSWSWSHRWSAATLI